MSENFYTILTAAGKAKIANALPTGQRVNLTKMKFGDGNGSYYNPNENQTELKNVVYECNITTVYVDEKNPNWITLTSVIPPEIGGFTIREIGVYDESNTLIAIGKYPETYKPILSDGGIKELYVKMTLEISNTNSVELKIDPYIILATKGDVNKVDEKLSSQLEQKSNYLEDERLNNDLILAPVFKKNENNTFEDVMYISENGLEFYKVTNYAYPSQFTNKPAGVDVSTMYKDGYFYQVYDYAKYPYEQFMIDSGYFLGGNGIQIRKTKDFINYEFIDVEIDRTYLQTWAPDWFVDDDGSVHIVISLSDCQSSFVNETDGKTQYVKKIYIISTTNLKTWTEPKIIDLPLNNVIDPFIFKENNKYYLFVKDEVTGKLKQYVSNYRDNGYSLLNILDETSSAVFEGPAVVKYKKGYYLFADAPNEGIVVFYTNNIEKWGNHTRVNTTNKEIVKHFTPIVLNTTDKRNIIKNLLKKVGSNPFANPNILTTHTSEIRKDYDNLVLYPNCNYRVPSNLSTSITISGYVVDLLKANDFCKFLLNSGNSNAKLNLMSSSKDTVWLPKTITLSNQTKTSNSVISLEKYDIGVFAEYTEKEESVETSIMPSQSGITLNDQFTTSGQTYVAPTDGWLALNFTTSGGGQYMNVTWVNEGRSIFVNTYHYSGYPCAFVPLSKGQTYRVDYTVTSVGSAKLYKSKSAL